MSARRALVGFFALVHAAQLASGFVPSAARLRPIVAHHGAVAAPSSVMMSAVAEEGRLKRLRKRVGKMFKSAPPPPPPELTDENCVDILHKSPRTLVDFHAEWCGPCTLSAPHFAKAAEVARKRGKTKFVQFVSADTEKCMLLITGPMLASGYKIEALPALVLLDYTGKALAHFEGRFDADTIDTFCKDNGI